MTTTVKTQDVAHEAGVSRATVSYVLNGRRDARISEATRTRVLDAARRIGYVGSPAARALRTGRGDVVLLLIPDWEVSGQLELLLEEIGQRVAVQNLVCLRYEGAHWQGNLRTVLARIPAACVVTFDPLDKEDEQALDSAGIPKIAARLLDYPGLLHTTAIDQRAIVAAQVDHLLAQGYEQLAYLAIEEPRGQLFTEARMTAFADLCSDRGVIAARSAVVSGDGESITSAIRAWATDLTSPLGVVAWNDLTALGVISAAASLGISIPAQLGVIGGDETPLASLTNPPLSSVRFDLTSEAAGIAREIATALGQELEEGPATATEAVHVVARLSTQRNN